MMWLLTLFKKSIDSFTKLDIILSNDFSSKLKFGYLLLEKSKKFTELHSDF